MNTRPVPPGCTPCAACGYQVTRRDKAGNISISLTAPPGVSITLREPICLGCAMKAKESTKAALSILRAGGTNMLAPKGKA